MVKLSNISLDTMAEISLAVLFLLFLALTKYVWKTGSTPLIASIVLLVLMVVFAVAMQFGKEIQRTLRRSQK